MEARYLEHLLGTRIHKVVAATAVTVNVDKSGEKIRAVSREGLDTAYSFASNAYCKS